jgi:hypothetical protein
MDGIEESLTVEFREPKIGTNGVEMFPLEQLVCFLALAAAGRRFVRRFPDAVVNGDADNTLK